MSRISQALHNDVQALEFLRDELKLQSHLFKAEATKSWQELEVRFDELKAKIKHAQSVAVAAQPDIQAAASLLIDSLKAGYAKLKAALKP